MDEQPQTRVHATKGVGYPSPAFPGRLRERGGDTIPVDDDLGTMLDDSTDVASPLDSGHVLVPVPMMKLTRRGGVVVVVVVMLRCDRTLHVKVAHVGYFVPGTTFRPCVAFANQVVVPHGGGGMTDRVGPRWYPPPPRLIESCRGRGGPWRIHGAVGSHVLGLSVVEAPKVTVFYRIPVVLLLLLLTMMMMMKPCVTCTLVVEKGTLL